MDINGTSGDDVIDATSAADTVNAGAGNDTVYGYDGNDKLNGGAGDDYLYGGAGNDTITGDAGFDRMYGGDGNDLLVSKRGTGPDFFDGGAGIDRVSADFVKSRRSIAFDLTNPTILQHIGDGSSMINVEQVSAIGSTFGDTMIGGSEIDTLDGYSGDDILKGNGGNDKLIGGTGNDTLTGGSGKDTFVFSSALNSSTNVDTITDFSVVDDLIHLENAIFTAFTKNGAISSGNFLKSTSPAAKDSNDFLVYETDTGNLFYDANGSKSGGSIMIAHLDKSLALSYQDFLIV